MKVICKFKKCKNRWMCSHAKPHAPNKQCKIRCTFMQFGEKHGEDLVVPSSCIPVSKFFKQSKKGNK